MKVLLVYISPNGTTRKSAGLLAENFKNNDHEVETIDLGSKNHRFDKKIIIEKILSSEIIGFGSPAYHMDILRPLGRLLSELRSSKETFLNQRAFLFLNYAGITSGKAFQNFYQSMRFLNIGILGGIKILAPHFHHHEHFPNEKTAFLVKKFTKYLEENHFQTIAMEKAKKVFSPVKKITHFIYPLVHLVGKFRELPITLDNAKCKKCQRCSAECPVGSIHFQNGVIKRNSSCIHCYHCTVSCKFNAITSPTNRLDGMIAVNKKILGTEEPASQLYV